MDLSHQNVFVVSCVSCIRGLILHCALLLAARVCGLLDIRHPGPQVEVHLATVHGTHAWPNQLNSTRTCTQWLLREAPGVRTGKCCDAIACRSKLVSAARRPAAGGSSSDNFGNPRVTKAHTQTFMTYPRMTFPRDLETYRCPGVAMAVCSLQGHAVVLRRR